MGWGPGIVATICGLLGVAAGKYAVYTLVLNDLDDECGQELATMMVTKFSFTDTFDPYDLL